MSPFIVFNALVMLLTLIESVAFYYLYRLHREIFLKHWLIAWSCYSLRFLFTVVGNVSGQHIIEAFFSDLFSLLSAFYLVISTLVMTDKKPAKWFYLLPYIILTLTLSCWFFDIISHFHHYPTIIFTGVCFIYAGKQFVTHQKFPPMLRKLLGLSLILWGAHKLDYPFFIDNPTGMMVGFTFSLMLSTAVTLSFILIYYQRHLEKLKLRDEFNNNLFSISPVGLALCAQSGDFIKINHSFASMLGHSIENFPYKSYREITPPEYAALDQQEFAILQESGFLPPFEKEYHNNIGERVPVEISAVGLTDEDGQIQYLSVVKDLSISKSYERELKEKMKDAEVAAKAKVNFLATTSHELRTPLHSICGISDSLLQLPLELETKKYVSLINKNSNHLLALINDILDVTKAENDRLELDVKSFSLKEMAADIVDLFEHHAKDKGLNFSFTIETSLSLHRSGDVMRLKQILINLISNAIKFTAQGDVSVCISGDDSIIHGVVEDSGIGMEEADIKFIFEPFRQSDPSITRHFGGTGLGLSICKILVEKMKGKISVTSGKNRGSRFSFYLHLPVAKASMVASNDDPKKPHTEILPIKKCLMVDDAKDNITLLKLYLRHQPVIIDEACNGVEALEKLKNNYYDLIIMDIHMPTMDGITATKNFRQWEKAQGQKETPIIGLTADALSYSEESLKNQGFNNIIIKPIKQNEFIAQVAQTLKNKDARS